MSTFVIEGGRRLKGEIPVGAGKNAPVALLFGALAVQGKVTFYDMSRVEEVERVLDMFRSIGVVCEWKNETTLHLDTSKDIDMSAIDVEACRRTRVALLFFGALNGRIKQYQLPRPEGCRLGERTVGPHLHALARLGMTVREHGNKYVVKSGVRVSHEIVMYESGDTATENAIMAAVRTPGLTTISFASANYMVQDLCYFLVASGAKIDGVGTTTLTIHGVTKLRDVSSYHIIPDPVDAMAWISLGVTTRSPLIIRNCAMDFLALELELLTLMGQSYAIENRRRSKSGHFVLADIVLTPSRLKALPDKLHARPYPGLNIDNVPLFIPILTQARGETLVHDWMYENRAIYYVDLQKLGARVLLLDPHRVLVHGPTKLLGNEVICPPALRPGMALLISMIAARGRSVLRNAYPIERGYERVVERLQAIGARITRLES